MPTPPKKSITVKKITAWSFSVWQKYVTCPFQAYCKFILKLPEPGSKALDNGNRIHSLSEAYVGKKVPELGYKEEPRTKAFTAELAKAAKGTLPVELETFTQEFAAIRLGGYKTEMQLCFRRDWSMTVYNDWNGVWLRVKMDAHKVTDRHGVVVDYKTGKKYPEKHDDAMELYALAMFVMYPQLETVMTALWYLDIGEETVRDFSRLEVPALKKQWEKSTFKMLNDVRFAPKPSNFACRYCAFSKEKGGPCKH